MRVKYRISFANEHIDLIERLDKKGMKYDRYETFTVFELFGDDENFEQLTEVLEHYNIPLTLSEAVFSQKEFDEAQWLSIRSTWRYDYPQPENLGYIFSTYDTTNYCDKCRKGMIQKENFIIKKVPNWGARHFFMTNLIHDELFISEKAANILKNSNLSGFDFYDILNKSNKSMEHVKQLYVNNYLDNGISEKSIRSEFVCPECGYKKYILKPDFIYYKKHAFEEIHEDIIKSNEKFGEIGCDSIIFITQKFYQTIKNNKLDKGLAFKPVKLVE